MSAPDWRTEEKLRATLARREEEAEDLQRRLDAEREMRVGAERERDEALREAVCDVCLGDPLPGTRACICGGTGKLAAAALGLREEMVRCDDRAERAESRAERLEAALREIESRTGHFGEAPPPPEWMPMLSLIAWVGRTARAALAEHRDAKAAAHEGEKEGERGA